MMSINLLKLKFSHIDYKMVEKKKHEVETLKCKRPNLVKNFGFKNPFKYLIVFFLNIIFINIFSLNSSSPLGCVQ